MPALLLNANVFAVLPWTSQRMAHSELDTLGNVRSSALFSCFVPSVDSPFFIENNHFLQDQAQ